MKLSRYIAWLLLTVVFSSCSDYLDIKPKGKVIPKTVKDYDELIGHGRIPAANYPVTEVCNDDIFMTDTRITSSINSATTKAYLWKDEFYTMDQDDSGWNSPYSIIYTCNLVAKEVMQATGGTDTDKKRVRAEALFNRAYYYWVLVNTYAKHYDKATANQDAGVPLMLEADLESTPVRATVAQVYDQMLADLNEAVQSLPTTSKNFYRVNKYGAYALLARVYLGMGDYVNALKNADLALTGNANLIDFNTYSFKNAARPFSGINNRPTEDVNPENFIYRSTGFSTILGSTSASAELMSVMGDKDLRFLFGFSRIDRAGKPITEPYPWFLNEVSYSIGVPEAMLIKAECEARAGNITAAVDLLNALRQKRFKPVDYVALSAGTNDEALQLVIDERRRELYQKGLRWFDLKRLNKDERFRKTIKRTYQGQEIVLESASNRYVLPIPAKVILLNPKIEQNPR